MNLKVIRIERSAGIGINLGFDWNSTEALAVAHQILGKCVVPSTVLAMIWRAKI